MSSNLNKRFRGIRTPTGANTVLGRVGQGSGDVQPVSISKLALKLNNTGIISGGPSPANPTAVAGPAAVNGSATTYMRSDAAPAVQKASASQFGIVEVDNTTITASGGVISATTASGANPTATAGPTAVNGSASTFMRSDGAPAVQKASASQFGIVEVDGTTITASSGVISATAPTVPSGANPTATAGPTAVNGSASTFMRSDAAPAVQKASSGQFGIVEVDGTTIMASGGVITAVGVSNPAPLYTSSYDGAQSAAGAPAASQGNIITPVQNMTILSITLYINGTAAGTYQAGIAPFNTGTKKITGTPSYGTTYTAVGNSPEPMTSVFNPGVTLTAGTTYILFVNWISAAAANTSMTLYFNSTTQLNPKYILTGNTAYGDGTTNPPSTGDTWSSEGDIYGMVLVYE